MPRPQKTSVQSIRERFRFFPLLAGLTCKIILSPLLAPHIGLSLFMDLFNAVLFFSGVCAVAGNRRNLVISLASGLVFLAATIAHRLTGSSTMASVIDVSGVVFLSVLIFDFCAHIVRRDTITVDIISGAITAYLMMAVLWAFIYDILYTLDPSGFNLPQRLAHDGRVMLYFSLVTLTTLGYGDISPVSPMARSWVVLEALVGQIYLVVVVAMLVGMFVSQKLMNRE